VRQGVKKRRAIVKRLFLSQEIDGDDAAMIFVESVLREWATAGLSLQEGESP
jgi:hypothetical protein